MRVILYDLDTAVLEGGKEYEAMLREKCDTLIHADGKYAPCQGCFGCWTRHPAECFMKDSLRYVCRVIGRAEEVVIITENLYGTYSPQIKNVLDRSIGSSTPFSTYRGRQMHHTLRYGKHKLFRVIVYGHITAEEKASFTYLVERNAVNEGTENYEVLFLEELSRLEEVL